PTVLRPTRTTRAPAHTHHQPLLQPPWFAGEREGVTLHQYLDEQFTPRFVQDAQAGRLTGTQAQGWYDGDKVGRYRDAPLLRLPMHRAFYVACCEVACATPGQPAFDPARITSAGMVVRRGAPGPGAERWMLRDEEALGWRPAPGVSDRPSKSRRAPGAVAAHLAGRNAGTGDDEVEPDTYRRYLARGLIQPRQPEPPYSGEETHPMHALLVRVRDHTGQLRNHTLLWGYVPLGGSYRVAETPSLSAGEAATAHVALQAELSWPFGSKDVRDRSASDTRPVLQGIATPAVRELIEALRRLGVAGSTDPNAEALRTLLGQIGFYPPPLPQPFPLPYDRYAVPQPGTEVFTLRQWLITCAADADAWLSALAAGRTDLSGSPLPWPGGGTMPYDLVISADQADSLRDLLASHAIRAMARNDLGLAMPRYAQGEDDIFHLRPFVRWQDDCGCERICWGQPSLPFRVASPLDPDFQRPQAIILPRLDDLKRGAARGVALLAPKSLADKLRTLSPDLPPGSDGPGNRCQLCWMVSLSIPVVTLCAMIILMILINLLNLLFGWLPWAILALPRWCGKLLKE
ncbi:MAG: hypothetical protein RL375_3425, partial [Pseudomonadota bacterium]